MNNFEHMRDNANLYAAEQESYRATGWFFMSFNLSTNQYKELLMSIKSIIEAIKRIFLGTPPKGKKISGTIKFFDRKKRFGFIISGKQSIFFTLLQPNRVISSIKRWRLLFNLTSYKGKKARKQTT